MWTRLLLLPGDLLDWLILLGVLALVGWAVATGLTLPPSSGFAEHGPALVLFEWAAVVLGAAAALRQLLGGRILPPAPLWGVAAAATVGLLSLSHTLYLYDSREGAALIIALSALTLAAVIALTSTRKVQLFAGGLVAVATWEALVALGQYASGAPTPAYWLSRTFALMIRTRAYGTLGSPNVLAGFLLLGIAAATVLAVSLPPAWRWIPAAALVLEVLALIVTYSRGGYVGLAVFAGLAAVLFWPIRRRGWPVLLLIVVVAAVAALRLPSVGARAQSIRAEQGQEDTGTSRRYIWRTALAMWRAHRTWGTGISTFNDAYTAFREPDVLQTYAMIAVPGSAHNDYLQLLATTGEVGVGLLAAAVVWGLWRGARRYWGGGDVDRAWLGGWAAGAAGIGAVSFVDENLFVVTNVSLLLLFSAAAGAQVSLADRRRVYWWERVFALPLIAAAVWLPPMLLAAPQAAALHAQASQQVIDEQFSDAVRSFIAAMAADPLDSVTPSYFGDLLVDLYDRRLNNPMGPWRSMRARATELYLRAMELNRWDPYPRAKLGRLEEREGRYAEAAAWLAAAVRLDPYTPLYRQWLGEALLLTGDRRDAARQLREAVRLYPIELLTIEHHEGRGARYAESAARLAAADRALKATGEAR